MAKISETAAICCGAALCVLALGSLVVILFTMQAHNGRLSAMMQTCLENGDVHHVCHHRVYGWDPRSIHDHLEAIHMTLAEGGEDG